MTSETSVLALYGLLVMLTIVLHVLLALRQVGLPYLASPRDEGRVLTGMAGRAERAVANSVVAMALFAPAVLLIYHAEATSNATLLAAQIFLVARVLYVPIYIAGIPWLRTGVWGVGFVATLVLYLAVI